MGAPMAASTSALPVLLVAARAPCLATGTPAAAETMAAAVDMLNALARLAPVRQCQRSIDDACAAPPCGRAWPRSARRFHRRTLLFWPAQPARRRFARRSPGRQRRSRAARLPPGASGRGRQKFLQAWRGAVRQLRRRRIAKGWNWDEAPSVKLLRSLLFPGRLLKKYGAGLIKSVGISLGKYLESEAHDGVAPPPSGGPSTSAG